MISGGMKLELPWQPYKDGIMQAKTPADLSMTSAYCCLKFIVLIELGILVEPNP